MLRGAPGDRLPARGALEMPPTPEAALSNHWAPPQGLHESLSHENYQAHSQAPTTKRTNLDSGGRAVLLKGASSRHCLPTQEDLSLSWKDPKPNSMLRRIVGKHTTWSVNKAEAGREPIRDDIATTSAAVTTSAATVSAALTNICDASDNGDGRLTSEHFPCASASHLLCMLLGICECGTMTS